MESKFDFCEWFQVALLLLCLAIDRKQLNLWISFSCSSFCILLEHFTRICEFQVSLQEFFLPMTPWFSSVHNSVIRSAGGDVECGVGEKVNTWDEVVGGGSNGDGVGLALEDLVHFNRVARIALHQ